MDQDADVEMPVTAPSAARSDQQGALAGLMASVIGVPMLGIGLIVALALQATVLRKILHHDVEFSNMRHGGTGMLANIALAVLIGFFAAVISGMISMRLVKDAATRAFIVVTAAGSLVTAFGVHRWLLHRAQGHAVDLGLLIAFGWIAATAGFYLAAAERDMPGKRRGGAGA